MTVYNFISKIAKVFGYCVVFVSIFIAPLLFFEELFSSIFHSQNIGHLCSWALLIIFISILVIEIDKTCKNSYQDGYEKAQKEYNKILEEFKTNSMSKNKTKETNQQFEILGEKFQIKYYPKLYQGYQKNPQWLDKQIQSIAKAWHEGDIVSAAQALESDLK